MDYVCSIIAYLWYQLRIEYLTDQTLINRLNFEKQYDLLISYGDTLAFLLDLVILSWHLPIR